MNWFSASRLVRNFAPFRTTTGIAVGSRLALALALLVACADLHSPPPAGAAGGGGVSDQGGANSAYGGGGGSVSVAGSSAGLNGGAGANGGRDASLGGSSGTAGAGAQGGSGRTAVDSGASAAGAAGEAGGAGGEAACARRDGGDIQAWLYQEITTSPTNEIHPFFALTKTGLSVPLKELAIRYYFSGEMSGDWQVTCLWVTKAGDTGHGLCADGVSMQIVALDPPRPQADQYLEVSFAGVSSATLSEGFPIEARSMFWRAGHPMMSQTNDYSFVATLDPVLNLDQRVYKQTSKVTVYRNGALIWGEEPCP